MDFLTVCSAVGAEERSLSCGVSAIGTSFSAIGGVSNGLGSFPFFWIWHIEGLNMLKDAFVLNTLSPITRHHLIRFLLITRWQLSFFSSRTLFPLTFRSLAWTSCQHVLVKLLSFGRLLLLPPR